MSNRVTLSPRDRSLLRLLDWTPATTALLLDASRAFEGGQPFTDDRRLRERLTALAGGGLVRAWPSAHPGGGLQNYYKISPVGFAALYGPDVELPPRAFFAELAPSTFRHTLRLAEAIVAVVKASHARRVEIVRFYRENELTLEVGPERLQPDCFVRLAASGKTFSFAFEIDTSQESLDSPASNGVRRKLTLYHAYQNRLLSSWLAGGKTWERPRFRVVFLTASVVRAYHILALSRRIQAHPSRRLVYAAPHDAFVTDADPLFAPLFLDHVGHWQSLLDLHPTAAFVKAPVRIAPTVPVSMESPFAG
jgi:hypothetical protein